MRASNLFQSNGLLATIASLVLVALISSSGCGSNDEPEEVSLPYSGLTIRIAVPNDVDFESSWDVLIREWEAQNEATVEIAPVTFDSEIATAGEIAKAYKKVNPTISFFPIQHLSSFEAAGLCKPFPSEELDESKLNWYDVFPGLRDQILSLEGKPAAIVTSCPTLKLFYRADLLDAANLAPPKTWEEYDKLTSSVDKWAPGLKVAEPTSAKFVLPWFFSRAFSQAKHPGNYSVLFDVYSGEPLIDSPAFVKALEQFAEHRKTVATSGGDLSPSDCLKELLEGRAAIAVATVHHSDNQQIERAGNIEVGCVPLPGSYRVFNSTTDSWEELPEDQLNRVPVAAFNGFCATVTKDANELETLAALNLARRISMPTPSSGFEDGRRSLCRSSWYGPAEGWMTDSLTGDEKLKSLDATSLTLSNTQVQAYLPFGNAEKYFDSLSKAIDEVTDGVSQPRDALASVKNTWTELAQSEREKLVNSYRRRLGLRPTTLP